MIDKTIYLVTPAYYKTGGTELAHQLVKLYNDNGIEAYIAYTGINDGKYPINDAFKCYVSKWIDYSEIPDTKESIVIVPEIDTELLINFQNAFKIIWWMSVDFFEKKSCFSGVAKHYGVLTAFKQLLLREINDIRYTIREADLHLYQSEYARQYLISQGINNILPLSDYINDAYFIEDIKYARENNVLYNPKKGFKFTRKIIKAFPELKWIPIEKMSTEEVVELLRKSKIYIDFGDHPGKDRFPRECAISGCCVITGKKGAAANDVDVSIPEQYKLKDDNKNIIKIGELIHDCIDNYDLRVNDFQKYRNKIYGEKEQFVADALHVIDVIDSKRGNKVNV